MAKAKKNNELRLVRLLDAPVKLVWDTWTQDENISKFWGPRGFTLTTTSKDVRIGGKWIYTMHGPDGVDYPNITTYHEVSPYKRLVYDHGGNQDRQALFQVTALFVESNDKTLLDMTMHFETAEAAQEIKKFIKQAGGDATWDRFNEYLTLKQTQKDVFIINRSFETDQKTLFETWTNPELVLKWLAPTGASMTFLSANIKAGESSHYAMTNADGSVMYGKINYKSIQPNDLLIYTQNFSDKDGRLTKPPFAPTWPDFMRTTVTFANEGDGETRVMLKWEIDNNATEIERQTFNQAKAGMTIGWTGSFDKLEAYLEETKNK